MKEDYMDCNFSNKLHLKNLGDQEAKEFFFIDEHIQECKICRKKDKSMIKKLNSLGQYIPHKELSNVQIRKITNKFKKIEKKILPTFNDKNSAENVSKKSDFFSFVFSRNNFYIMTVTILLYYILKSFNI